jgi:hypothetical protein
MKNLKTFEKYSMSDIPEIGDYIQLNYISGWGLEYEDMIIFLSTHIGKVISLIFDFEHKIIGVQIQYYNIPKNIKHQFPSDGVKSTDLSNIAAFAKTPTELKLKLQSNKYNL